MTKELADLLCYAMDDEGTEYDRLDDYSGRGMYGEKTVGIVLGDIQTLLGIVAKNSSALSRITPEAGLAEAADHFARAVRRLRIDQMGKSDIIVY